MKALSRKFSSVLAVTAITATMALASPVSAGVQTFGKTYSVTATVKGGKNLTVLLISGSGRLLASKKVTRANQKITLKSPATASIGGTSLQLVNSGGKSKGSYFGPVTIGHKGKSATKASRVYTRLKQSISRSVKLGTLTIKKVGAGKQGYAVASATSKSADTSVGAQVKASKGRPLGVGTFGKTAGVAIKSYGVSATAIGDPCSPPNTATCGPDGKEIGPPSGNPVNPPTPPTPGQPNAGQPATGQPNAGQPNAGQPTQQGAVISKDDTLGGDKDDDGIPNAFDVNDDGDAVLDSADTSTPAPKVAVDDGTKDCSAVDFRIFTNYKATQGGFAGTINAYGVGGFKADKTNIASTITKTMSMVFSPITQVCGSPVTRSFLKGIDVPYAPTDYVELSKTCGTGDYQWLIGAGKMCGTDASGFSFGSAYTFGDTLPTGQDTFSMKVETADGKKYEFTSSPGFVFVTHPMFIAYSNDGTNYTNIDYTNATTGPEGARITEPTISVTQSQTLYLKVYRPQRLAMDGEKGDFYDLGGFKFTPDIPNGTPSVGKCDALTSTDTEMTSDTPINAASPPVMTLQWAIGTKCYGAPPKNIPWAPAPSDFDIQVEPSGPGGNSAQKIRITLS
ncbi:MAG: hypothetical protein NWQ72_04640 [Ilumatobacteraceae bacterium]|jgi:hypothetical protein|nr:hypothetical protein [Ilumatobacteraceae bacterium]MDP5068165.1 hypothetical protein [Ilumatobacteraceae bacterium]